MMRGPTLSSSGSSHAVALDELDQLIVLLPEFAGLAHNKVDHVRVARTFAELEAARPLEIVVVDPLLAPAVSTYRFDLALGRLNPQVRAVLGGRPSATAVRTALSRGIALGELAPGVDFSTLLLLVRDLARGRREREISILESMCAACDAAESVDDLADLITDASQLLGTAIEIRGTPNSTTDELIRLVGAAPMYLVDEGAGLTDSPIAKAARAYLARRIGSLLQAELDAEAAAVVPISELVNEILLDDVDNLEIINRLRRTDFPIDGAHNAIRIDCHGPPDSDGPQMTTRLRQQIAEAALFAAQDSPGHWTRTGTLASIVLIGSQPASERQSGPLDISRSVARVVEAIERLDANVHIGVGTTQVGVGGLRATVGEATVALRSAVDIRSFNEPHYFDRLGLGRALMQWAEIDWVRPVVNETLAPILSLPPDRRRETLRTLRIYLETGRSVGKTAQRLHIHRNSVRYRIGRIEQAIDVDFDDPDERLFVELGCRLFVED